MNASESRVDSNTLLRWRDVNFIIAQYNAFDAHNNPILQGSRHLYCYFLLSTKNMK